MSEFENNDQNSAAKAAYDKDARQEFKFEGEDDENRYVLTFAVEGLPDADLFEYDKLSETQVISKNKNNQLFKTNAIPASRWFFEERIQLIDGFDGELPDNWREDFDDEERAAVVNALLDCDVVVKEETKILGKRKFGQAKANNLITLKAAFNGEETLLDFDFPPKNSDQIGKFRAITVGAIFKKGREGRFMRETWEAICALYDELKVQCDANPAAHLKVLAMRERFEANLQSQTKKSSY
ncbi:MAG TPA: hypothetical protein VGC76_14505 [Pyrinomonadaceae bacterium]|jgi:hypothetical protein